MWVVISDPDFCWCWVAADRDTDCGRVWSITLDSGFFAVRSGAILLRFVFVLVAVAGVWLVMSCCDGGDCLCVLWCVFVVVSTTWCLGWDLKINITIFVSSILLSANV